MESVSAKRIGRPSGDRDRVEGIFTALEQYGIEYIPAIRSCADGWENRRGKSTTTSWTT
jgi:hypothetical protein